VLIFEAVMGLKINLSKSVPIPISEVPNLCDLAAFFGCGVQLFALAVPVILLGLPFISCIEVL